jgi:hypothetical protein
MYSVMSGLKSAPLGSAAMMRYRNDRPVSHDLQHLIEPTAQSHTD